MVYKKMEVEKCDFLLDLAGMQPFVAEDAVGYMFVLR